MAVIISVVCSVLASRLPVIRTVDDFVIDRRLAVTAPRVLREEIVIVGISDTTLKTLPAWGPTALDRATYAPVIERLNEAGASVIAIDVFFGAADAPPGANQKLGEAIAKAGNVIVVGDVSVEIRGNQERRVNFELPIAEVANAAVGVVSPMLFQPGDAVRGVRLWQNDDADGRVFPALSFAVAERARGGALRVLERSWPLMPIRWAGAAGTVPALAFEDVFTGDFDAASVRDRVVYVGRLHQMDDRLPTPVGPMSGVEIHAQATATLLAQDSPRVVGRVAGLCIAVGLCLLLALLASHKPPWAIAGLSVAMMAAYVGVSYIGVSYLNTVLPAAAPGLSLLGFGAVFSLGQARRMLKIIRTWAPMWVKSEGEEVDVTVLVCDLSGYTSRSETSAPSEMLRLLQHFFAVVDETVQPPRGVLARRPGDAAVVFFRAEPNAAHHARRGLVAAVALRDRLMKEWANTDIDFGITLTTGTVSLGIVGTSPPEPQILGDPVNVAFRLQEETRRLGERIIADWPTTRADPEMARHMRPLGEVHVRNRTQPVQLFAPAEDLPRQ